MKFFVIGCITLCLIWGTSDPSYAMNIPKGRNYYEANNEIVWEVPTKSKVIALTFDDGPDTIETNEILALLEQYNAKSTFFVVGNRVDKYPELVKTVLTAGHEIANHTYYHTYFNKQRTPAFIEQELSKTSDAIFRATGIRPTLFRPPGGYYNENMVNTIRNAGYQIILWSWHQDTEDWKGPAVSKIVNKVLNNARNGDIVLFHDHVEGKSSTPAALKQILPELKRRGFEFITVSELLTYKKNK